MNQKGEKKVENYSFNLKDTIGIGSFGEVYKGKDAKTNKVVAIKMIKKANIDSDPYLRESLMNEIKVMRKLKSQFIVELIDILETSNNYYLIQEYCDSGDLAGLLKKEKKVPFDRAMKIIVDMLTGFQELIKHGIVHRDLKPANILINQQHYKLADFGFAKSVDNFKKQILVSAVGTPLYMSPQILKDEVYTTKSDIWSFAFIFYELLYGRTPWTGRSIPELVNNIYKTTLQFPTTVVISDDAKDFLSKCLKSEESDRISWDDIYRHPLFGNTFSAYIQQIKKVEDRANFLINDIRLIISRDQIDLEELFTKFDINNKKKLQIKDLEKLLKVVDKNLTREEIEFIFNKVDKDGSLSIEFEEFKNWLTSNDVMLSTKKKPQLKQFNTINVNQEIEQDIKSPLIVDQQGQNGQNAQNQQYPQNQQYGQGIQNQQGIYPQQSPQQYQQSNQQFQYPNPQQNPGSQPTNYNYPQQQVQNPQINKQSTPVNDQLFERSNIIIMKLITQIKAQNLKLNELFLKYSKQDQFYMQNTELETMIRIVDPKVSKDEMRIICQIFDKDRDGKICQADFCLSIQEKMQLQAQSQNPIQQYYPQPNQYSQPQYYQQQQQNKGRY